MKFNAYQIAKILNGKIEGNPEVEVDGFSKIEEGKRGTLTFLANLKYSYFIYKTDASIVLVNNDFVPEKEIPSTLTLIRVSNAYAALATLLQLVEQNKIRKQGIEHPSFISDSATIAKEVYIGAFAYIGEKVSIGRNTVIYPHTYIGDGVTIGENTVIYAGVKIYEKCHIGSNCIIHAGVVIGSDGFGFAQKENQYQKIPQMGNVVIENDVEIGANTTIDRAAIGSTIIRQGVKLDNLIQVAHHVEIGADTVVAAQTGISGSVQIGKNCRIGGQVGFGGHIKIGDNVCIGAQSGIISNIIDDQSIMGSPAINVNQFLRAGIIMPRLPEMYRKIESLQKEVEALRAVTNITTKSIN